MAITVQFFEVDNRVYSAEISLIKHISEKGVEAEFYA